ncbi:hypothetical protein PspLS_08642 [Pyricularia sp. CBS 133598]|nr:hypothetical protein PspLS_08642 [Pyricularia sp. CBS 133598]
MLKTLGERHLRRCRPKESGTKSGSFCRYHAIQLHRSKRIEQKKKKEKKREGGDQLQHSTAQLKHLLPPSHIKGLTQLAIDSNPCKPY